MKTPEGPLTGKTILVTRPVDQSELLLSRIKEEGGIPLPFPVVAIQGASVSDHENLFNELSDFQWIIFTSKNGVDYFFKLINDRGLSLNNQKFAAVGEKTALSLQEWGIASVLVPNTFDAAALAEMLKQHVKTGDKLLFPKGSLAPSYIKDELRDFAYVEEVVVYETRPAENLDWTLIKKADCFFFLSPSAVFFMMDHPELKNNSKVLSAPVFCIGPATKKAALEIGFKHVFMPERYTAEDMVKRAASYFQGGS